MRAKRPSPFIEVWTCKLFTQVLLYITIHYSLLLPIMWLCIPSAVSGAVQYAEAPAWYARQLCSDLLATLEGPDEGNGGHGIRAGSWPPSLQGSAPPEAHHVSVDGLLPLECSQPMRFLHPLRILWVTSPLHLARAQMFALTPLVTHLPEASPSNSCCWT